MGSLIGCLTATRAALSADEKANLNDLKSEAIARGMGDHAAEVYAIESMLSEAIDSYVSVVSQVESALGISKKKKNKDEPKVESPNAKRETLKQDHPDDIEPPNKPADDSLTDEKLPAGTFNDPSLPVNTGVSARMVVIDKPAGSSLAGLSLSDDSNAAISEDGSISKVEADEVIARITARWGKPDIVDLVDRFTDLPPAIKRAAAAHRASPNQVKGAIHNGRLYVVRENHKTTASLERTVFHEAYGHYGIRALFGNEIHQKLNQLFLAIGGSRGFNEMAARNGVDLKLYRAMKDLPQEMRRAAMMEELLSHMAEDRRPNIARRAKEIIGMVRKWLRDHGFPFLGKLGDTDIAYLLKQARERTIAGEEGSIIAKPAFSLRDQTETPAFKRWFGDSKVVDNSFANLLSQPDGVGILLSDLLAAQNASGSGLNPVQALMLALAKNDKIGRGIVGLVPVDVVNSFTKDGFRPEDGGGNTSMFVNALNTPVSDQVLSTFRGTLTSLSAKLANTIATGRDQEVGPALLASDFNLREMGALLSLQGRADFWGGDAGVESVGASKAAKSSSASLRPPTENLKLSPAALADLLNKFVSFAPHSKSSISDDLPSSKYIAEQGEPLVVYHGSPNSGIVSFDRSREGSNTGAADAQHGLGGFYFSDDSNVADTYARTIDVEMANVAEQEFGISPRVSLPQSTTYPVYLSIKNPLRVDGIVTRKMLDKAERDGHDGVIARIGPQTEYVAFRPEQIKSSIGNNGNFDPDSANIMFSLQDDEQTHDALAKLGLAPKKRKTIAGIIAQYTQRDWKSLLKQLGERGYEGWVDGLIGIKRAEESLGVGIGAGDYQRSGYVGARLATGIADLMHGILFYGAPEWRDGVTQYRAGTKGLIEVLQQLEGDELTDWLAWMGANRAQELMDQGRENNLTQDEIDTLKAGSQGNEAKFEQVRQDYLKINRAMLDLAQDAGLIKAESRAAWESEWYVPFYRMSEADGEAALLGPTTKRGLSHQSSGIRALKGADLATNDLMENIIANWLKLADASLKNDALRRTVDILDGSDLIKNESMRWSKVVVPRSEIAKHIEQDRKAQLYWAEALGMPEGASAMEIVGELNALDKSGFESLWHRVAPTDKDIVRVMRDGKANYYRITASDGGALLRALTQVQGDRVDNVLLRAGRWSKRLLTTGVTASPEFILRNFIRDAAHAWAINPDGFTFGVDSLRGLREAWAEDEAYRTLMFAGASFQGGYVHGTDPEASAQIIRRALEKKGLTPTQIEGHLSTVVNSAAKAKDLVMMAWQAYREVGDKVENANRVATFEAALKAGKPLAQAAFESKDLMDYSRRGNAAAANIFMDLIPFLNARLQGLDKLARAGFSTPKLIGAAMLKIALWSVFLAWLNDDEDDYKALPDWEKDAYWHIYLGDSHWRIPKPFEIGLLAGTIPERMWHAWIADTQPDDKVVWSMAHGMMETLNFNPIPQAVLPVAEIVANRSFFFNTPIESQRDQGVQPEARYDSFTSDSAVLAGKALGLSPKQIEHLWKGYTGTMGGYAMALTDMLVRGVRGDADRPEMRPEDLVLVRALYRGEDAPRSTQYQIDFYNRLREVEQIYGTVKQYQKEGDIDAARSERDEGREKLRYRGLLTNTADVLSDLRKREKYIMDHPTMPAGEKRLKLNAINQKRNDLLKRAAERTEGVF